MLYRITRKTVDSNTFTENRRYWDNDAESTYQVNLTYKLN